METTTEIPVNNLDQQPLKMATITQPPIILHHNPPTITSQPIETHNTPTIPPQNPSIITDKPIETQKTPRITIHPIKIDDSPIITSPPIELEEAGVVFPALLKENEEDVPDDVWRCSACTLLNPLATNECEVCGQLRKIEIIEIIEEEEEEEGKEMRKKLYE